MIGRKKSAGAISASELMARLQNDTAYQSMAQAADADRQIRVQELRRAEQPIVADLRAVGVAVDSVWDLVNTSEPYPNALPVLLSHLERGGYPDRVMESLGSALAVKPSVVFWDRLRDRYLAARSPGEEEGTAVALAACATRAQIDDLIAFLGIAERGDSRIYFLRPIQRLGGERGEALLTSLQNDPTFEREARALLGKQGR